MADTKYISYIEDDNNQYKFQLDHPQQVTMQDGKTLLSEVLVYNANRTGLGKYVNIESDNIFLGIASPTATTDNHKNSITIYKDGTIDIEGWHPNRQVKFYSQGIIWDERDPYKSRTCYIDVPKNIGYMYLTIFTEQQYYKIDQYIIMGKDDEELIVLPMNEKHGYWSKNTVNMKDTPRLAITSKPNNRLELQFMYSDPDEGYSGVIPFHLDYIISNVPYIPF